MSSARHIVPLDRLAEEIDKVRRSGHKIALANGIFDILHVGHLRYLEAARALADFLVVAVNSVHSLLQHARLTGGTLIPVLLRSMHVRPLCSKSIVNASDATQKRLGLRIQLQ